LFKTNVTQNNSNNKKFFDSQWGAHYLTAFEMFKSEPFHGIGIGQFRNNCADKKYETIKSSSKDIRCSSHPHNIYLEIFAETGVFTGISFLIFFAFFFYKIIKIIFSKNLKKFENTIQYNLFLSFFTVSIIIFFPFKASGSFFSNFYGSFIWYNLTILYIYLLYFQNLLKKKR
jgi:O-antigen ligase